MLSMLSTFAFVVWATYLYNLVPTMFWKRGSFTLFSTVHSKNIYYFFRILQPRNYFSCKDYLRNENWKEFLMKSLQLEVFKYEIIKNYWKRVNLSADLTHNYICRLMQLKR